MLDRLVENYCLFFSLITYITDTNENEAQESVSDNEEPVQRKTLDSDSDEEVVVKSKRRTVLDSSDED